MKKLVTTVGLLACYAVLALLSACEPPHVQPIQYRDRVVEVLKPVAVQPIKPEDVPTVPAPLGPRPPTVQQQEDALLSKVCEFVAYVLKADPALRISAGLKPVELALYPECKTH